MKHVPISKEYFYQNKYKKKLEEKYSLESTDPRESEICAPRQLTIVLKLSYYLFIIAKLFKVKDGCLKFVIPAKAFARDYGITGVGLSVCLFVCYHDN